MVVISTRDFRANQTKFLDMARNGEHVILKSRNSGSFRLTPIKEKAKKEKPVRDLTDDLVAALREVKDHMDGKIQLKSAKSLIDEL